MLRNTTCENGHWKPDPLDIDCLNTKASHVSMTTTSIPFSTDARLSSNNYIVYIFSSLVCLFVLTTIMVTLNVICWLKYCWRKERSGSTTPDITYNAVDPLYETINKEVSTNTVHSPMLVEMCGNIAYSCRNDSYLQALMVTMNSKDAQQTFYEPSTVNTGTVRNEAYSPSDNNSKHTLQRSSDFHIHSQKRTNYKHSPNNCI